MAGKRLDKERVSQAWAAYAERGSVADMRDRARLGHYQAKRLLEVGAPEHGIGPFKERYAVAQRTAAEELATQAARDVGDALGLLRANLGRLNELTTAVATATLATVAASGFKVRDPASALRAIASALKVSTEIEAMLSLLAQPVGGDETQDAEALFGGWTSEELLAYATTGEWPAGKRRSAGASPDKGQVH